MRGFSIAWFAASAALALGAGAATAAESDIAARVRSTGPAAWSQFYGPGYYAPGYYGPGYYRRGPTDGEIAAGVIGGLAAGAIAAGAAAAATAPDAPLSPEMMAYCARKYRSFDPATGTYLSSRDGQRYVCN